MKRSLLFVISLGLFSLATFNVAAQYATIQQGESVQLPQLFENVFEWRDDKGNNVENTIVSPQETTTYTVYYFDEKGKNQLHKGDFEGMSELEKMSVSGHYAYLEDYDPSSQVPVSERGPGTYGIGSSPKNLFPGDLSLVTPIQFGTEVYASAWYKDMGDHTTGTGEMLYVDADENPNMIVYSSQLTVNPNTKYFFSAWFANVHTRLLNPFDLEFRIDGEIVGRFRGEVSGQTMVDVLNPFSEVYRPQLVDVGVEGWYQYLTIWESGSEETVQIEILNNNTLGVGNDFAIDDLSFGPLSRADYQVVVDQPVGVYASEETEINVYPNPSSGLISLNSKFPIDKVEVFNLLGEKVAASVCNTNQVDLGNLDNGVYLLQFNLQEKTILKKIIINN